MINNTEILVYKAFENSSNASNGGIMTNNLSVTNSNGNVFPDISDTERLSGSTKYRKIFWKLNNTDNTALNNPYIYLAQYTTGADTITFFEGSHTDTQSSITGNERRYGAAPLETSVIVETSVFTVVPEDINDSNMIIQTGDSIIIHDNDKQFKYDNITAVPVDNKITITLDTGDKLMDSFDASDTIVSSVCAINDIIGSCTSAIITSTSGSYDDSTYPIEHRNKGGLEQTWTLTFSNSTQFSCSGNTIGNVGVGSTTTDFSPINTKMSSPYFMLRFAGWNSGWQAGDKLQFTTHPAAKGVWFKRVVPAGALSSTNKFEHRIVGEAAV